MNTGHEDKEQSTGEYSRLWEAREESNFGQGLAKQTSSSLQWS